MVQAPAKTGSKYIVVVIPICVMKAMIGKIGTTITTLIHGKSLTIKSILMTYGFTAEESGASLMKVVIGTGGANGRIAFTLQTTEITTCATIVCVGFPIINSGHSAKTSVVVVAKLKQMKLTGNKFKKISKMLSKIGGMKTETESTPARNS